jgi:hypothetical protein
MITYSENENGMIERTNEDDTISFIPEDLANTDYQEYLAQLETE